jgi:hypothetical protein
MSPRGHPTPSISENGGVIKKCNLIEIKFFLQQQIQRFGGSRRPKHEKAKANLDSERCSYIEEACKQKNASGNDCPNFEENRGGDAAKGF